MGPSETSTCVTCELAPHLHYDSKRLLDADCIDKGCQAIQVGLLAVAEAACGGLAALAMAWEVRSKSLITRLAQHGQSAPAAGRQIQVGATMKHGCCC